MLESYRKHVQERAALNVPPLPLDAEQTAALCDLLKSPPAGEEAFLMTLLCDRIPPGVDPASYVKASFLTAIAKGETTSPLLSPKKAVELLGTMLGGYNVASLIELLKDDRQEIAQLATDALKKTLLIYDAFNEVIELAGTNTYAQQVVDAWANADWFTSKPEVPEAITVTVFNVPGETNTDDLSPAPHATTRPDIPLHAQVMLEAKMENPLGTLAEL
ncbi:MAG: aconitate hydratase B, partial [Cyanobacteria bacterium J06560_2]